MHEEMEFSRLFNKFAHNQIFNDGFGTPAKTK